ncbi:MAG: glycyl-radical enzyme activating protein [Thermodesulfobacteriota bacterium]
MTETATILHLQRMSTEDGPGIRTTVFFKGCTLACRWCHNPESISPAPEVQWIATRCIGCKTCISVCPEKALDLSAQGMAINRKKCTGCGVCAAECPSTAMELLGTVYTVAQLADEVEKDRAFFEQSGGGVTISGGEPTLQPAFAAAFLAECRKRGLATALDTCGETPLASLLAVAEHADMVLFDLKEIDPARHKRFTGRDNARILKNLAALSKALASREKPGTLWVRTPVIPGATDTEEVVSRIGSYMAQNLDGAVSRWDLCAFNNLCRDKYLRLGLVWDYAAAGLLPRERMEGLFAAARTTGVRPEIVQWSGATAD